MGTYMREPINGLTHLFGAILSFVGLLAMVIKASTTADSTLTIVSVIIFGISMTLLYAASATYHLVVAKAHVIAFLRRLDHSMIFVLIAGTYTPLCLISLSGMTGWVLFTIISAIAVAGVSFKLIWFHAPRWLSTALYIAMGWIVVFFSSSLAPVLGTNGMALLIIGGLIYTVGAFIYWLKPKFMNFKHFGFHEIFHIFILLGSLFHFLCVYLYVL
ncbi:PAQR family membrane homeostasis protein TrhA [Oceanobacillus jordanicus]|uniref:Hemolysin III family protein n=1 Tax=Oceanobacillus jordanicus TaxID=2867266 RepID=A0AAW5B821_9BACI|nr:hemolysin III family protein [Oceanobacillus jordanicus]MCG3419699.1 hemolysin III family protein [Oceanobacillus jordanicus]